MNFERAKQFFTHLPKTNMKHYLTKILNYAPIAGGVLIIGLAVFIFSGEVRADNTVGDLINQKAMIELRIEQAKAEYQSVSEERASLQESCNIANQKSEQLKQLQELNGARRNEVKAIDQKLSTLQGNLTVSQ